MQENKKQEDNTQESVEYLQSDVYATVADYLPKLIRTANLVAGEFQEGEQEDTRDLFDQVVEGINWVLDVYNHSPSALYRGQGRGEKTQLEQMIQRLSQAISRNNKSEMANSLSEDMIPFLHAFHEEILLLR